MAAKKHSKSKGRRGGRPDRKMLMDRRAMENNRSTTPERRIHNSTIFREEAGSTYIKDLPFFEKVLRAKRKLEERLLAEMDKE